jgi:competence protein ComGC
MNEEINKLTKKTKRRLIIAAIIVIAILSIFMLLISLRMIYKHNLQREQLEAREFLVQIIESVKNQTDLYKKKAYARDIREIEIYRDKFSDNYEIELIDSDLGFYEYIITFNHEDRFYVNVIADDNGFTLSNLKKFDEDF